MPPRWLMIAGAPAALSGCSGYTEKTSPCACDWAPVATGASAAA